MFRKLSALTVLAAIAAPLHAQYAVDQRVNTQVPHTGNLFDASPSLNSGRINTGVRPVSPMIGGNAFATGNIGRGLSLRSYSPIADPSAFGAPLGSGSLYEFRRDSVSGFDALRPQGGFAQPYYDPSTTAYTAGMLQGFQSSSPAAAAWSVGGVAPTSIPRLPSGSALAIRPSTTFQSDGPYGPASLQKPPSAYSSIFGPPTVATPTVPRLPIPSVADLDPITQRALQVGQPRTNPAAEIGPRPLGSASATLSTPLSNVLNSGPRMQLGPVTSSGFGPPSESSSASPDLKPGLIIPARTEGATPGAAAAAAVTPRAMTDPSVLPGYDVFTDMRLALALQRNPGADWFNEMRTAALATPELAPSPTETAGVDAQTFLDKMLESRLTSMTGKGASAVNDLMLKAESLLSIGNYTEAADRYHAAHLIEPTNPLPLIGRGHALLAAGEYRSAAAALIAGIERFPEVSRFSFDLNTLLGGAESIDIRRADLMRRLAERETPELRFLLGYIEYQAGDKDRGKVDLERAAVLDRGATMISKYPSLLQRDAALPPPKVTLPPSDTQPAPPTP